MYLVSVPDLSGLVSLSVLCLVVVVFAKIQNASGTADVVASAVGTVSRRRLHRPHAARMGRELFFLLFSLLVLGLAISSTPVLAQSTFGSVIGTVSDASGAVVRGATVTLVNVDTAVERKVATDNTGGYSFFNLDAGKYNLTVQAQGFQRLEFSNLDLQARETKRVDASLKIGAPTETVNVEGAAAGVITTDESNLTVTRTGQELADLPVAIYSRSNGSTSPISTLTTQSGVQTDTSGNLIIAGTTPALLSVTLDGISGMNIEYAGPINELFPSFNSISEMKVSEVNNNAEFSGVSDITTTSKGGGNRFHGGAFENHEDSSLASGDPFALSKPKLVMNDFGGYVGGPIRHDKTFFFASYEGLRLPRETPIVTSVPSLAMRSGNLCSYLSGQGIAQVYQPNGTPIPCGSVPINPVSANFMKYLLPLPNTGASSSYINNFAENLATPVSSNQGDVRIDQNITPRQSIFGRLTYKDRSVSTAPNPYCPGFCEIAGSPSTGAFSQPETDLGLTFAYNFVIRPSLLNEARGGISRYHLATTLNVNSQNILSEVGIVGIPNPDPHGAVPSVVFGNNFQQTGGANPSTQISQTIELADNLTWTKGKHTLKFGGDFRRLSDHDDNAFGSWRSGTYLFNGSSAVGATIKDQFTSFLLGYPDAVLLTLIKDDQMNGLGHSYGFFAQDDWKVTPSLTINAGLRYELHPPLHDTGYNSGAFLPSYQATVGGQTVHGAIVVPNQQALALTDPGFAASIVPTPILTAQQAGIPSALRYTYTKDFGPRIGFAWRPFHDDKTVLRGGYGRFIQSPLGFNLVSGWATTSSYIPYFGQGYSGPNNTGAPILSFPSPFYTPLDFPEPGTASFFYAFPVHYIDPSVQQWNLTLERELGFNTGLRISYAGNHGGNLQDMVDLNQVAPNTVGYGVAGANRPFPIWGIVESVANGARSNYNALTVEAHKRFTNGLQFDSSYVFTRDLSDAGGSNPTAIPTEPPQFVSDRFNYGLDYGNVIYDRRHRFVTTYLYELPFGRGKKFLGGSSDLVNGLLGGWEWGGVLTFESGPFLTPYQTSNDSAGTNELGVVGSARADVVPGVSVYAPHGATSGGYPLFLNSAAFAVPAANIGRFGDAAVGSVVGPRTGIVSMSLIKTVPIKESWRLQFGAEASNLFNHKNYEPPNMQVGSGGFGTITALQTAEGAGPRIVELTARISF